MKEFKIYHTIRYSAPVSLIVILVMIHTEQSLNKSSFAQVVAQSQRTSSSKTNELSSSKLRESFWQFRKKHQPVVRQKQQQQTTRINQLNAEQQVLEPPAQPNQFIEHQQQVTSNRAQQTVEESFDSQQRSVESINSEPMYGSVEGKPGVDFPNYAMIPNTKFSCDGVPFEPGMYADESTGCQVYHLCYQGRRESFLCGIGTVFNQAIMNCDFWHSVDCSKSSLYYGLNAEFGKSLPEPSGNNFQSSFQTGVSQFEQSSGLIRPQIQQQFVSSQQSSIVVPPSRANFAGNEQTVQSVRQFSSGGKVSLPKQQQSLSSISRSSIPSPASRQPGRRFELQRKDANFVSPGGKAAQLSKVTQQQFASAESSLMSSFAAGGESTKTRKVGSSLVVDNFKETRTQSENNVDVGGDANDSGANLASKLSKSSSSQASKKESEEPIWKPYFRSKTKSTTVGAGGKMRDSSVPAAPVNQGTSSTPTSVTTQPNDAPEPKVTGADSQADGPLPTVAQPDQEPTFSSEENSSPATSNEAPSIPKSSVPPPTTTISNKTEDPSDAGTSVTSNIESDVGAVLSTTTQASSEAATTTAPTTTTSDTTSEAAEAELTTTTSTAPTTSLETLPPSSDKSHVGTTTASSEMPTTTSATEAPALTTTSSATTQNQNEPEASSMQASENGGGGSSPAEADGENKKKRGVLGAGVEYAADEGGGKKPIAESQTRANQSSSSVEYVAKDRP